jgi:hypothetical protein
MQEDIQVFHGYARLLPDTANTIKGDFDYCVTSVQRPTSVEERLSFGSATYK